MTNTLILGLAVGQIILWLMIFGLQGQVKRLEKKMEAQDLDIDCMLKEQAGIQEQLDAKTKLLKVSDDQGATAHIRTMRG